MNPRVNSVVESVASAAASIRSQRHEGVVVMDEKGAEVSAWLKEMIEVSRKELTPIVCSFQ